MDKRCIRLGFTDFWPGFDPDRNYFTDLLRTRYEIEITDRPEFLIYSVFGKRHRRHDCIRIFYTGENVRPNFAECDYAFTYDLDVQYPGHYRLPICWRRNPEGLIKGPVDAARIFGEKTGFCAFVVSNPNCEMRNRCFRELSKYRVVSSGGKLFNNVGGRVQHKHEFLRRHKFTIAFENESYPGYCTEKLVEAMHAWSIPIYWGNPSVHLDFNTKSFLNFHDYGSLEALIERVIEVDRNDDLYLEYLRQPWLLNNEIPQPMRREHILASFDTIFSTSKIPVAILPTWRKRFFRTFSRRA